MADSQLFQIIIFCLHSFPAFPKYHADSSPHPLVNLFKPVSHICQFVVVYPARYELFQLLFPSLIIWYISSPGQSFDFRLHLSLGLPVYPGLISFLVLIKSISQEFNFPSIV